MIAFQVERTYQRLLQIQVIAKVIVEQQFSISNQGKLIECFRLLFTTQCIDIIYSNFHIDHDRIHRF